MTPEEIQKRNGKANNIRVIQTQDGDLFASSEEELILYKVTYGEGKESHSAAFCPFFFGPALFRANTGFRNRPV